MLGNQLDEKNQIFTWKMACEITISIHFKRVVLRFQENMKGSLLPEVATRLALHEKKTCGSQFLSEIWAYQKKNV